MVNCNSYVRLGVVSALISGLASVAASGQTPATHPSFPTGVISAAGITHTFLAHAPIQGKVYKIAPNGDVAGEYNIGTKGEDSWLLPNARLLGSHNGGVRELDMSTGAITWEYKAGAGVEVHSCQPLLDGRVLICECGSKRLFEINRDLSIAHEIKLESNQPAHRQFRLARKTEAGTYLVAYGSDAIVRELDADGKTLKSFVVPPKKNPGVNGGFRLPNGNTLVTAGYGAEVYEFDRDAKIIWTLAESDLPAGFQLHYMGTAQRLPNGNTVLSNFQGLPDVLEITPEKKVVWQYHNEKIGPVSACMVVDEDIKPVGPAGARPSGARMTEAEVLAAALPEMRRAFSFGIDREGPFKASLKDGVWHVSGTLPPRTAGGTAEADVRDSDGKILRVFHTQ